MNLRLVREPTSEATTHGVLFADGHFVCFTLEDAIREVAGLTVSGWKIQGQTAIPAGTYPVQLTPSVRFGVVLPLLVGVPGFSGVRMHAGNSIADTDGCILVGQDRAKGRILKSRVALTQLMDLLTTDTRAHSIRIEHPEVS